MELGPAGEVASRRPLDGVSNRWAWRLPDGRLLVLSGRAEVRELDSENRPSGRRALRTPAAEADSAARLADGATLVTARGASALLQKQPGRARA